MVDLLDLSGVDVERDHLMVLGQQRGHGQADVAGAGDGDFHIDCFVIDSCLRLMGGR